MKKNMSKEKIREKQKQLLEKVGAFCIQKLNEEYFELCEKLILKMGRKREVPFKRGKLNIWASAVVYAIGSLNFLFDNSFEPHISPDEICEYFGTKKSTVSNKASQIKNMFDLWYFNPEFSTERMTKSSPFNNMVMVDGLILPIKSLPIEMQEIVKRERSLGRDIEFKTEP
jgi:hypothetical protein